MAEIRADTDNAFDFFIQAYGAKYDKAVECLARDRDRLPTFYDFPAEHWKHVRSSVPRQRVNGGVKWGHRGGVKRGHRRLRAFPRSPREGPVGPRGQAWARWSVHSSNGRLEVTRIEPRS